MEDEENMDKILKKIQNADINEAIKVDSLIKLYFDEMNCDSVTIKNSFTEINVQKENREGLKIITEANMIISKGDSEIVALIPKEICVIGHKKE